MELVLGEIERIPHLPKSQTLEVLHIHRRQLRHALRGHGEGGAGVVEFAEGEGGGAGIFPERVVQRAALGGEADEPPAGMRAVGLDDLDGFIGGERALQHGGVAEESIKFSQDELGNGHVFLVLNGGEPGVGSGMSRRVLVEGVQEEVRVDGEHELFSTRTGVDEFGGGQLSLGLDFRVAQPFPPESSGLRQLPFAVRVRLGGIDAEDVFDAAPGEFGEGDFAGFAQLFRAGEGVVGELDLSSRHANSLTAQQDAVNVAVRRAGSAASPHRSFAD